MSIKANSMDNFIKKKEKEFSLCKMLLKVRCATKKLKAEEFNMNHELIQSVEATMTELKQLWAAFKAEPSPGAKYRQRIKTRRRTLKALIEDLKKQTNFFSGKMYGPDILAVLEKATTKFIETAG